MKLVTYVGDDEVLVCAECDEAQLLEDYFSDLKVRMTGSNMRQQI